MIEISFRNTNTGLEAVTTIPDEHGPSLRSAIEEIRNEVGGRTEGAFAFKKEHALTTASSALGRLASVANTVIPEGDPDYE